MRYRIWFLLLFIIGVAIYDGYLVIRTEQGEGISQYEENPVGVWLLNRGGPTMFLEAKALGTCVVVGILLLLHRYAKPSVSLPVASALAIFQGVLLISLQR